MDKMKAVITVAPRHSVVREIDRPQMNDNSVMIKIKYCGVCCSEHWDWAHPEGEIGFGHEPMGIICEVGKNVTGYQAGDRVSGLWGSTLPGTGAMVEYAVADPRKSTIIRLPDHIRDEDLIVEPLSCMFSAVSKVDCSMPGTPVCVVGCGYMGCGAVSLLKLRGCRVTAVDIRESSRQDALRYGAWEALSPEEAIAKYIDGYKGENHLDAGFPCVCEWAENNDSLDLAIRLTKMCGQLCVGAYHTGPKRELNMQALGVKDIRLFNTHPREPQLSATGARYSVELLESGLWNYHDIPTMIYPMNQFDRAQQELETKYGHHMKAVINMEMEDGEPYMAR